MPTSSSNRGFFEIGIFHGKTEVDLNILWCFIKGRKP